MKKMDIKYRYIIKSPQEVLDFLNMSQRTIDLHKIGLYEHNGKIYKYLGSLLGEDNFVEMDANKQYDDFAEKEEQDKQREVKVYEQKYLDDSERIQ